MTKKTCHGSCHCGAVAFEANIDFEKKTTRCSCSICTKSHFWFAIVSPEDFRVERGEDRMLNPTFAIASARSVVSARTPRGT